MACDRLSRPQGKWLFGVIFSMALATLLLVASGARAETSSNSGERRLRSTEEVLQSLIPTLQTTDPHRLAQDSYQPQLGDVIFRVGLSEMSEWYRWFFREDYTHSAIVTQVEPEVVLTHCTKEKYVSGVNQKPFSKWSLRAERIQIFRLKNRDPEVVNHVLEACRSMLEEGVLFDSTWDYERAIAEPGEKRFMYCSVFIWAAFMEAGIDLAPQPHRETGLWRRFVLFLGGVRHMHWTFITIGNLRESGEFELLTEFEPRPITVNETIRLQAYLPTRFSQLDPQPVYEPIANDNPTELLPHTTGRKRILVPHVSSRLHKSQNRIPDPINRINLFENIQVRQSVRPIGPETEADEVKEEAGE